MLFEAMSYCKNWFVTEIHKGNISIQDNTINLNGKEFTPNAYTDFLRLIGGHTNEQMFDSSKVLENDEFEGEIWELAPPQEFIKLCDKIREWNDENKPNDKTSESFGGYSYSKATNNNGVPLTWQDVFAKELRAYKKI